MATNTHGINVGGGVWAYYGRLKMDVPLAGAAIRQVNFLVPLLSVTESPDADTPGTPTILVTIDSAGAGVSDCMPIFNVTTAPNGETTIVKVTAQSLDNLPRDGDYFCNLMLIGRPLK